MIKLLGQFPESATPALGIDPKSLRATVDLDGLAGRLISGKHFQACAFDDAPIDHASSGIAGIGLRCGSWASGVVAIGAIATPTPTPTPTDDPAHESTPTTTPMAPAAERWDGVIPNPSSATDIVVCTRHTRQNDCYLRHGMVQLSTTVDSPGPRRGPARGGCGHGLSASALMAQVAHLLATSR